jgi:cytochrome b
VGKSDVLAWDGPTRLFKWALVIVVLDGWLSNKYGASTPAWHKWNGYTALVLVAFRIFWGFSGGTTARFANFVPSPGAIILYVRKGSKYLGHNPMGGLMVVALLVLVGLQGTTGLFSADDDRLVIEGPLVNVVSDQVVDFASRWHGRIFLGLEIFVAVHIAANIAYEFVGRQPLIRAMITGRKPAADYVDMASAQPASWFTAVACLAAAVVLVFGSIYAAGGRPF